MFPRPTRNYIRALITGVVFLVLLIPQVIAAIRLFAGPGYPEVRLLPPFIFVMLAFLQFTVIVTIVQLVRTEHDLRAAVRGDDRVAPPALTQPDQLQALRDGKRLTLERRMRNPVYWRTLGLVTLMVPLAAAMLAYFGEAIVFLAAPHASGWILEWIFNRQDALMLVPPPPLTSFEWSLVALPVVPAMALCIYGPWEQLSVRRQVITCDDQGITVKWRWRRRAFIPWNDIQLLINGRSGGYNGLVYWLRGERHGIILDFGNVLPPARDGNPRRPVYDYAGGIEVYETHIQCLLATIAVRAHVPLRTWAIGYYQQTHNLELIPVGLTADEVAAMPLATALSQPRPGAIADAAASTAPITLCANIPVGPLLRQATKYGLSIGVPMLLLVVFIGLAESGGSFSKAFPGFAGPGGILLGAFIVCCLYSMGVLLAAQTYRNRNPAITVDSEGLTARCFNKKELGTIDWTDVRAWGMVQSAPGATDAITYAIYSASGDMLLWAEPANARLVWQRVAGDRRAAYHVTAEQLHATIVACTGLPLHVIPPRQ